MEQGFIVAGLEFLGDDEEPVRVLLDFIRYQIAGKSIE